MNHLETYLDKVNSRYKLGNSTEHTFRGDLQTLLESICPDAQVTNEPTRIECGAPDYIITKKEIPVGTFLSIVRQTYRTPKTPMMRLPGSPGG